MATLPRLKWPIWRKLELCSGAGANDLHQLALIAGQITCWSIASWPVAGRRRSRAIWN